MGDPHLYEFSVGLFSFDGVLRDEITIDAGIRTIEWV
jgi:beta-galactosidase/beta-glucuronidase